MQNDVAAGRGEGRRGRKDGSGSMSGKREEEDKSSVSVPKEEEQKDTGFDDRVSSSSSEVITVVVSKPEEVSSQNDEPGMGTGKVADAAEVVHSSPKKEFLQRNESYHVVCREDYFAHMGFYRVCQQQTEEPLLNLGCGCRGDIAKAHQSCIDIWFRTRGSNKCEICQQVATNIPSPDSLQSGVTTVQIHDTGICDLIIYWIWRADPASGSSLIWRGQRGCCSPIWLAFSILVSGLFLDVLLSVSLGVSALPVNFIVGILILLGLGTAFRLALECCHEWSSGRNLHMTDTTLNPGYPPPV